MTRGRDPGGIASSRSVVAEVEHRPDRGILKRREARPDPGARGRAPSQSCALDLFLKIQVGVAAEAALIIV
jgi:hypothetical protein